MKETTTAQSVRAAVAYFILVDVWAHLACRNNEPAVEIVERLKREHLRNADEASLDAIRGFHGWRTIDLEAWGQDCDNDLPEATCEGCDERVSCCKCDDGWGNDAGRTAIGNTPTCECCGKPLEECQAEQNDIWDRNHAREVSE